MKRFLTAVPVILVCFSPSTAAAQRVERDVPYGSDVKQRLDLALPGGTGFPTIIFVHGGSLTGGDKADEDYADVCRPFPPAGIGCVNVNYRLAPAHRWPAQAEDIAAAVAWVAEHIESRRGDRRQLFLLGHSSGAMLVALLGTDGQYLSRHGLTPGDLGGVMPMGSIMWDDDLEQAIERQGKDRVAERFSSRPDNAMYDGMDQYRDIWPIRHLGPGLPRFLFLIAEGEQENPPVLRTNRLFVERTRVLGNRADYRVLADRTHTSAIRRLTEPGDAAFLAIRDFVLTP